jgi:hypothetical protein
MPASCPIKTFFLGGKGTILLFLGGGVAYGHCLMADLGCATQKNQWHATFDIHSISLLSLIVCFSSCYFPDSYLFIGPF